MPIAHIHLPEKPFFVHNDRLREIANRAALIIERLHHYGAVLDFGQPGQVADITPPYWQNDADPQAANFLLTMKRTPHAARLFIIPRVGGPGPDNIGLDVVTPQGAQSIRGNAINIPAKQESVTISRATKNGLRIGGLVLYADEERAAALRDDFPLNRP